MGTLDYGNEGIFIVRQVKCVLLVLFLATGILTIYLNELTAITKRYS